jgi:hypothetical protein
VREIQVVKIKIRILIWNGPWLHRSPNPSSRHRARRLRKLERTPSGVSWLIDGHVILTAPASQVKSPAQQPENLQGTTGASSPRETMTVDWFEQFSWNG